MGVARRMVPGIEGNRTGRATRLPVGYCGGASMAPRCGTPMGARIDVFIRALTDAFNTCIGPHMGMPTGALTTWPLEPLRLDTVPDAYGGGAAGGGVTFGSGTSAVSVSMSASGVRLLSSAMRT